MFESAFVVRTTLEDYSGRNELVWEDVVAAERHIHNVGVAHRSPSQHLATHGRFLGFGIISIEKKHEVRVNCTCLFNDGHRLAF